MQFSAVTWSEQMRFCRSTNEIRSSELKSILDFRARKKKKQKNWSVYVCCMYTAVLTSDGFLFTVYNLFIELRKWWRAHCHVKNVRIPWILFMPGCCCCCFYFSLSTKYLLEWKLCCWTTIKYLSVTTMVEFSGTVLLLLFVSLFSRIHLNNSFGNIWIKEVAFFLFIRC